MITHYSTGQPRWVVYEANGGTDGAGDRVYGPYHSKHRADQVADYINEFTQELGRAWVLPLLPVSEAPDPKETASR